MNNETPPQGIPTPPEGDSSNGLDEQRSERMSRSRERQQRRQRQPMVQPAGSRSMTRPTLPTDSFKLPPIKLPPRNWLYAIGSILLVVIVVFVLGRLRNEEAAVPPNAIWIGTEWTYDPYDEQSLRNFVQRLRDHQIGTVYAWVSWLQEDQSWRGTDNFENVKAFVTHFKELYPEAQLYGWIGVPNETGNIPYRLDNVGVQQIVADFSSRVMDEFGFDGVYLNVETVWNNDQNFLAMLRQVRTAVGEEVRISAAIPPDWSPIGANIPVPPLIVPGTIWDPDYKRSVALLIDEMAVMAYNSALSTPADYSVWMAYQVSVYAQAVSELGGGTDVIIGIPTYDNELPGHDVNVETITAAMQGYRAGLVQAGDAAQYVRGVAPYASWETDDAEWAEFRRNLTGG